MRERSKRYIKHCYQLTAGAMFWSAVIGTLYLSVLYTNVYGNDDT